MANMGPRSPGSHPGPVLARPSQDWADLMPAPKGFWASTGQYWPVGAREGSQGSQDPWEGPRTPGPLDSTVLTGPRAPGTPGPGVPGPQIPLYCIRDPWARTPDPLILH